jgi:DNA-binding transcriptional LysR family regulator
MQQVRYFVALAETLDFTRAAEACNVTQPALTRAIQALEGELGGDLIRREGRLSHLTDLGKRMLPLLRQCYDSALSAKAVARSVASGEARSLALGLSRTVDLRLLGEVLAELFRQYPNLRLKLRRGGRGQIVDYLRDGDVEIAIAGPIGALWDRLDAWPLFSESFDLLVAPTHALATRNAPEIQLEALLDETFLLLNDSETAEEEVRRLEEAGICLDRTHTVDSDGDIAALVEANIGVALTPRSALRDFGLVRHMSPNIDLRRTVAVYTVAGRARSPEASTLLAQIRAADWDGAAP